MTGTPQILHIEFTSHDGKVYKVGYDDFYVGDEKHNASLRLGPLIKGVSTTRKFLAHRWSGWWVTVNCLSALALWFGLGSELGFGS